MLNRHARPLLSRVVDPLARALLRLGVGPDAVTIGGLLGVVLAALWFFPRGELLTGTLVVTVFVLADLLDGAMARQLRRSGGWGAFLDSTCDRVGDAAVLGSLVWWALVGTGQGRGPEISPAHAQLLGAGALSALCLGFLVSYARARAEGLGVRADVGLAERAERLIVVLVSTGLVGLGAPVALLTVALWVLVLASLVTVAQRISAVRRGVA
ncbi:CDP-diacylglycerol inositol 3-phosphatidyltransferase [Kytococcus aerolatus]|uniref:Phosphatidylinositol phosphate synthase n=1 Tax=Kytococcus aerolatus TaxID=592308 RepID=A0A212T2T5_9MICO|nr:CDP-alcohol phosphatidyltransferase family protein [Kytococcus aerolatus]SNC60357.1 CDP-diacylglycerol inositol 3-phosphatidyltransferase [Kytococcus aerolatus]